MFKQKTLAVTATRENFAGTKTKLINNDLQNQDKDKDKMEKVKKIIEIRRRLKITNADIAKWFGFRNAKSYSSSTAKKRIDNGIIELYNKMQEIADK